MSKIKIDLRDENMTLKQAKALGGVLLYIRDEEDLYITKDTIFDGDIMIVGKNNLHIDLPSYIDVNGVITHCKPVETSVVKKDVVKKAAAKRKSA